MCQLWRHSNNILLTKSAEVFFWSPGGKWCNNLQLIIYWSSSFIVHWIHFIIILIECIIAIDKSDKILHEKSFCIKTKMVNMNMQLNETSSHNIVICYSEIRHPVIKQYGNQLVFCKIQYKSIHWTQYCCSLFHLFIEFEKMCPTILLV